MKRHFCAVQKYKNKVYANTKTNSKNSCRLADVAAFPCFLPTAGGDQQHKH